MQTKNNYMPRKSALFAAIALATSSGLTSNQAQAADDGFFAGWELSGYVRQHMSFNLEEPTLIGPDFQQRDDYKYDVSMARTTLKLDLYKNFGNYRVKITGRAAQEIETDYLKDLQQVSDEWAQTGGVVGSPINLMDDNYDDIELREFWVEGALTDTVDFKIGRQQVVWGETDFFALLDVVHGYDYRWRSFLEPENEELRKPLNMVNLVKRFDDIDASLQFLYIPGSLNDVDDRGNSYDVEGGRWANNPNKGIAFAGAPFGANVKYNRTHPEADLEDDSFGLRWSGIAGDWGYSLGYFRGPSIDPVANANPATNPGEPQLQTGPYGGIYQGGAGEAGEFIFPTVDVLGFTANNYFSGIDAVFSTEIAYIIDSPMNVGRESIAEGPGCGFFPGFCGIEERDVVATMFRLDKQVDLSSALGTSRPSFLSVQLFDKWIMDYDHADQLVNLAGFGADRNEHNTIVTGILAMNYDNDKINPTLAVGADLTNGGGFIIPSVEIVYGDHWRLRVEADLFFDSNTQDVPLAGFNDTNLFGYFSGNDQLVVRLTYQF
jgi:hypothetical protein